MIVDTTIHEDCLDCMKLIPIFLTVIPETYQKSILPSLIIDSFGINNENKSLEVVPSIYICELDEEDEEDKEWMSDESRHRIELKEVTLLY